MCLLNSIATIDLSLILYFCDVQRKINSTFLPMHENCQNTEFFQSKYRKIWSRKNCVCKYFSGSIWNLLIMAVLLSGGNTNVLLCLNYSFSSFFFPYLIFFSVFIFSLFILGFFLCFVCLFFRESQFS